jgi:RNA polymerase sigma factor (sigma-70 family)
MRKADKTEPPAEPRAARAPSPGNVVDLTRQPIERPFPVHTLPRRAEVAETLVVVQRELRRKYHCSFDTAEDVSAEVLVRVYEKWRTSGKTWQSFTGWAVTVACNAYVDRYRRDRRYVSFEDIPGGAVPLADPDQSPEALCVLRMCVATASRNLKPSDRLILILTADGAKQKTIAARFNISPSAVSQRLVKIHAILRESLDPQTPPSVPRRPAYGGGGAPGGTLQKNAGGGVPRERKG